MKVLVIDDNRDIVESTIEALEMMGIGAVGCTRGQDVLDAVRREGPDVVLQDVRMPGLDLVETLQALRDDPAIADTPVLLFTANRSVVEHLDGTLVQGIVQKPFDLDALVAQIEDAAG